MGREKKDSVTVDMMFVCLYYCIYYFPSGRLTPALRCVHSKAPSCSAPQRGPLYGSNWRPHGPHLQRLGCVTWGKICSHLNWRLDAVSNKHQYMQLSVWSLNWGRSCNPFLFQGPRRLPAEGMCGALVCCNGLHVTRCSMFYVLYSIGRRRLPTGVYVCVGSVTGWPLTPSQGASVCAVSIRIPSPWWAAHIAPCRGRIQNDWTTNTWRRLWAAPDILRQMARCK